MSHTPTQTEARNQIKPWFELADKSLDETEKLVALHLDTCRSTLQEMVRYCKSASAVQDVPGAFNLQAGALKPFAELSAQYGARMMGLASSAAREFSRALENLWQGMARQSSGWMGDMPASGVQGPEAMLEYLRNSARAFDQVWDSARPKLEPSPDKGLALVPSGKNAAKSAARKAG